METNGTNGSVYPSSTSSAPRQMEGEREKAPAGRTKTEELQGLVDAINRSQASIEFDVAGNVITANANFLSVMGYSLDEIRGRHHRIFVDAEAAGGEDYRRFWDELRNGRFQAAQYRRVAKGGRDVWLEASYNPIVDASGRVVKIVKYATDVTTQRTKTADYEGQLKAIHKVMAVIEFSLDGTITDANDNFLSALGYGRDEVKGRHHRMFVDPAYAASGDYTRFWQDLNAGRFQAGEYRRIGKGGREVWINASYNPILDANGKPTKVVKYATDITAQKIAAVRQAKLVDAIDGSSKSIAAASTELSTVSTQLANAAQATTTQANVVATSSEQVSKNVQTVATGTEEMSASIREIAKSASDAARVATSAVKVAETTSSTMTRLGDSSAEIGKVVKVITSIAQQTNLLALNATIEAARAGDAGKGFAVVANEVKELARETAKATEDISRKVEAIQSETRSAMAAIAQISGIVNEINDLQTTIASAVEEQTATTNEMSRNVLEAAKSSEEIARNIGSVAKTAAETTTGAKDAMGAANELARLASDLALLVSTSN